MTSSRNEHATEEQLAHFYRSFVAFFFSCNILSVHLLFMTRSASKQATRIEFSQNSIHGKVGEEICAIHTAFIPSG